MAAHRGEFSIVGMCEALGVSKSGYYNWLTTKERGLTETQQSRENLKIDITHSFHQSFGTYGAPRIKKDMEEAGYNVSEKTVGRLMAELGLYACKQKNFVITTDSDHAYPVSRNLLRQNFKVKKPNQVWVSDLTYIWTSEGWVYLSSVMDLYSRKIIGWEVTDHMRTEGPLAALEMAILFRNPGSNLIHHSDRGSQYASNKYRDKLESIKAKSSMSRCGNPYDNACMESFFATLKKEWVYRHSFRTKEEATHKINLFISSFYNSVRRHSNNAYLSPDNFEYRYQVVEKSASYPKKILYECLSHLACAL